MTKVQRCGYEKAVLEFKNLKKTPYVYGSAKGGDFLELRSDGICVAVIRQRS